MKKKIILLATSMLVLLSCSTQVNDDNTSVRPEIPDWKNELEKTIKLYGHRNWIVVADAAYPMQSNPAIKTITADTDQIEVVEYVNQLIKESMHVDANIFIDKELAYVPETDGPGIESYRSNLNNLLKTRTVERMLHEDIIRKLDESAKLFNVLIIKTKLDLPYTSVFYQLECGYWNAEAEENLRNQMND